MDKSNLSSNEKWQKHLQFDSTNDVDHKRRLFSFIAMTITGIVVFSGFIFTHYQIHPLILTVTLVFCLAGMSGALILYFTTKSLEHATLISGFVILVLVFLLVYSGGKENTALYWLMFSPLVAYATLGIYKGSVLILTIIIGIVVMLYGPEIGQAIYSTTEKSRFLGSYCVVILFAFINEYFRDQSFETLNTFSLEQREKANSDSLTGLPNRRFIDSCLIPQIKRKQGQFFPMSVVMADIDTFKEINDTFGHDIGDAAIIHVAHLFKNAVRSSDVVARYGGEEFLIYLPKAPLNITRDIAEKMRLSLVNNPFVINEQITPLTCSFGVSEVEDVVYFEQAVKQADQKLFQAKKSGKNKVVS